MKAITYFLVLTLTGCFGESTHVPEPPQAVRVQAVRTGPIVAGRRHLAEVVPTTAVRVLAQVHGAVETLAAEGATVGAGDAVAAIAAPEVAARAARATAERERAEREREFACALQATDRALAASGDIPTLQRDQSEKSCDAAGRAVEAARAAEREVRVGVTRTTERAPFDGVVLARLVDSGQTVLPGTPLLQLGSTARQLRLRVAESDLADVALGTVVHTAWGTGHVVTIASQGEGPARLVEVLAELDGPLEARIGATTTVTLVGDARAEAVAVPVDALGEDASGAFVIVVDGDRARRLEVIPGPRQDGWVAISPAPPPDAWVVVGAPGHVDVARPVFAVQP